MSDLKSQFGDIDIYLFDPAPSWTPPTGMRVLDAGCGSGRNLVYLLQSGYDVFATDGDAGSIQRVHELAAALAPHLPIAELQGRVVEHMTFPDSFADVVLSSAVLHFSHDHDQFCGHGERNVAGAKSGGMLFSGSPPR